MLGSLGRALSSVFMSLWRAGKTVLMMMGNTMDNIAERVTGIVVEHLGVAKEKVSESSSFFDDLGADSLDTVELVMAFEEEFTVEVPDDAVEKILTVKDAIDYLQNNAAGS